MTNYCRSVTILAEISGLGDPGVPYFKPIVKSSVGLAVTKVRLQFQIKYALAPGKTIQVIVSDGYRFLGETVNEYGVIDEPMTNVGAPCDPTDNTVALLAEFPRLFRKALHVFLIMCLVRWFLIRKLC